LINHLEIPIKIIYLDASNKEVADELYIPEDTDRSKVFITFLYRPGHYDLLYS
jgi:Peptidase C65 Otubain.